MVCGLRVLIKSGPGNQPAGGPTCLRRGGGEAVCGVLCGMWGRVPSWWELKIATSLGSGVSPSSYILVLSCSVSPTHPELKSHKGTLFSSLFSHPSIHLSPLSLCHWISSAGSGATEEGLTSRGGRNLRLPLRFGLRPQGPCRVGTGESGLVLCGGMELRLPLKLFKE